MSADKRWYVMSRYQNEVRDWMLRRPVVAHRVTSIYTHATATPRESLRGRLPVEGDELVRLPGYEDGPMWQEAEDALAAIDRNGIFTDRQDAG